MKFVILIPFSIIGGVLSSWFAFWVFSISGVNVGSILILAAFTVVLILISLILRKVLKRF